MNTEHLCPDCFRETYQNGVCSFCGYRHDPTASSRHHLKQFCFLHEQYVIGRVLGAGGFGITYKAYDIFNKTTCAVKEFMPNGIAVRSYDQLHVQLNSQDDLPVYQHGLKRFVEEAMILRKLQNVEAVVNVTDYFYENDTAYFVMPYLDGSHLKKVFRDMGQRLPFELGVMVMRRIGGALMRVHEQAKLLHRDVSPENIMITTTGELYLIDFGNARIYMTERSTNMSVFLKPGYAPPEQYSSKGKQGPWTDVYSLAATFYFLVSGVAIPEAPDRLNGRQIQPLNALVPECPPQIAAAIERALMLNPSMRTQSMRELLSVFPETGRTTMPLVIPPPTTPPPPQPQPEPVLEVIYGEQQGNKWVLFPDIELKIGRSPEQCNIVLAKYPQVSTLHCVVTYSSKFQKFFVQDVSTNGTALDGRPLMRDFVYQITPGQQIALAGNTCVFRLGLDA